MEHDRLILKKIIKIVATRCQILRLKCTKFDFGWGSTPDPSGGAYSAPPDPLAGFQGPTSKGREGNGRGREGSGREEKRGEERYKGSLLLRKGRGGKGWHGKGGGEERGKGWKGSGKDPWYLLTPPIDKTIS